MTSKPSGNDPKKPDYREDPPDLELDKRRFTAPKPIQGFRNFVTKRRPVIEEVVRETTSGGIVFRQNAKKQVEILLIQDAKGRWTIPKGHVEEGEETKYTAEREIREETGLQEMKVGGYLGKVNFRYRRAHTLVLMTMHIYLVEGLGDTNKLVGEDWLTDIKWLPATDAVEKIAYEDIGKLILVGMKRIREGKV
jgi:8-oxo-dGTP pyrophosphatase MutT (NUDIX family)